ncbi:MAG: hypothetical protein AB1781_03750 [Pseudomonadota bacterium]
METQWSVSLIWWITAVELPTLASLFWLIWRARSEAQASLERLYHAFQTDADEHRMNLATFKLEVAKFYASIAHLKDVETRLSRHLQRIEDKLDNQIQRWR